MGRAFALLLMLLGFVLFFVGQWIAFEIYANMKLSKIGNNMAQFINHLHSGDTLINLKDADENVFILRTATGRVVATGNAIGPLKPGDFMTANYTRDGNQSYVYTKKVGFSEYLDTFIEKPLALGVSLSGLIVFLSGLTLLLREIKGVDKEGKGDKNKVVLSEDLIKRLKALRVAFAMSGVIPQESLSEAKRILDDIIKKTEGKS